MDFTIGGPDGLYNLDLLDFTIGGPVGLYN